MIVVTPDISLVYQMLNFIILLFVMNFVLYRPIRNMLLERKAKLVDLGDLADKAEHDLSEQKDTYKDGIKAARQEGLREKEARMDLAAQQEKEILEEISQKAASNLAQIKSQVAKEAEEAKAALENEVEDFARIIGEKILGRPC